MNTPLPNIPLVSIIVPLYNHARYVEATLESFRTEERILCWAVPSPVLLSPRELYDPEQGVGNYDESMLIEDRSLYLRLIARRVLGFINRSVMAYRMHARNTIRSKRVRQAVYDAIYRTEGEAIEYFGEFEKETLRFIVERSRLHLGKVRGPQKGAWALRLSLSSLALQVRLNALNRHVALKHRRTQA